MTTPANAVIEILTLTLKPGTRDWVHRLYVNEALPLLVRWGFHVVAHGPSLHDENSYYVIRAYESVEARQREEDAYYGSDDWRQGPKEAVMAMIEHEAYTVVSLKTLQTWLDTLVYEG